MKVGAGMEASAVVGIGVGVAPAVKPESVVDEDEEC